MQIQLLRTAEAFPLFHWQNTTELHVLFAHSELWVFYSGSYSRCNQEEILSLPQIANLNLQKELMVGSNW